MSGNFFSENDEITGFERQLKIQFSTNTLISKEELREVFAFRFWTRYGQKIPWSRHLSRSPILSGRAILSHRK